MKIVTTTLLAACVAGAALAEDDSALESCLRTFHVGSKDSVVTRGSSANHEWRGNAAFVRRQDGSVGYLTSSHLSRRTIIGSQRCGSNSMFIPARERRTAPAPCGRYRYGSRVTICSQQRVSGGWTVLRSIGVPRLLEPREIALCNRAGVRCAPGGMWAIPCADRYGLPGRSGSPVFQNGCVVGVVICGGVTYGGQRILCFETIR